MNVVAKSSPILKATINVINVGAAPITHGGKIQRQKMLFDLPMQRILGSTLGKDLLSGAVTVSSGIGSKFYHFV